MSRVEQALEFAKQAHGEQVRKYTGEPYWKHLEEVMKFVAIVCDDEDVRIAAILHDVVEDTDYTAADIEKRFGARVARLVLEVTDVSKPEDGNRAKRKAIDREHLAKCSRDGATIKLADMLSNTKSITAYDPNFAKIYLKEKVLVLPLLTHGNRRLWAKCESILLNHNADKE